MRILNFERDFKIIKSIILKGEILCSPTDTQFGIIGNSLNKTTVFKAYKVKEREPKKPLIILFDSIETIKKYGILIPEEYRNLLQTIWPGKLTAILPIDGTSPFRKIFKKDNIAVRIPNHKWLLKLIKETGPLFAPSANPQDKTPAKNCKECISYFKEKIKYCIEGTGNPVPSTIVSLIENNPIIIRQGHISTETIKSLTQTER